MKVPQEDAKLIGLEANEEIDGEMYYVATNSILEHAYAVSVMIGLFFLSVVGGLGFVFLPYNLLNDFIFRPKPISETDFKMR